VCFSRAYRPSPPPAPGLLCPACCALRLQVADCDTSDIVVEASSPGFDAVQIHVPVSVDAATDSVLAVAKATAANFSDGFSYLTTFVG
jgi:hypothetical protein